MARDGADSKAQGSQPELSPKAVYEHRLTAAWAAFAADGDGHAACLARSDALDDLIRMLWAELTAPSLEAEFAILALGGYGRRQVFPFSDVDLLFCTAKAVSAQPAADLIRGLTQALWDCGLKLAPVTRSLADCDRWRAEDPEHGIALLDLRPVAGRADLAEALIGKMRQRSAREGQALAADLAALTRNRYGRFGQTLFHLEPNVKDSPGGLRDIHVCRWLDQLRSGSMAEDTAAFAEAVLFLEGTRVFLHLRHGRDNNLLDWDAQDAAAAASVGFQRGLTPPSLDAASWMRVYFRHARAVERMLGRELEQNGLQPPADRVSRRMQSTGATGFVVRKGVLYLNAPPTNPGKPGDPSADPAEDAEAVLAAFQAVAETGVKLASASEVRIGNAIPALSASLEEGPRLWTRLRAILAGRFAGRALRELHALGVLELIVPEFHGIDALVIRDAYHRYTVDEHTFVLIDTLHALETKPAAGAPEWYHRFHKILQELPHPDLLYLAALLHDTGKGRVAEQHAAMSAQLARAVCSRLELGSYEAGLVVRLVDCHLEMSAALRRDIFDPESVRSFAGTVGTHELLRMLLLFTYADISAVHPDALTPWKAENLWRLTMSTANQLDRSVDDERVEANSGIRGYLLRSVLQGSGCGVVERGALEQFLQGFPERYLRARSPQTIYRHFQMAQNGASFAVLLEPKGAMEELTVLSHERPQLFVGLAAVLAAWGMDVVSGEAFSNARGMVVDTFRFTDGFQTLKLNPEERQRFLAELAEGVSAQTGMAASLPLRRRLRAPLRRRVDTRVDFDNLASSHSTLLHLVSQDLPGLLHAAAAMLSAAGCNIEVALIDTEGEMAIDTFYLTRDGQKLALEGLPQLRDGLLQAIGDNAAALSMPGRMN